MASNSRVPDPSSTRFGLEPMRRQPQNIWHIVSATCRSLFPRIVFGIMPWNPVKSRFVGYSEKCRSRVRNGVLGLGVSKRNYDGFQELWTTRVGVGILTPTDS